MISAPLLFLIDHVVMIWNLGPVWQQFQFEVAVNFCRYYVCSGYWNFFSVAQFLTHHFVKSFGCFYNSMYIFLLYMNIYFFLVYMHCVCCQRCSGAQGSKFSGYWNCCHNRSQWLLAERWWQFGGWMSCKSHTFPSKIWYFALPASSTSSLSLKICIWTLIYHLNVLGKF